MAIPVQNLYYLLSYAWDDRLESTDLEGVDDEKCSNLETFFAQVLTQRLAPLLRRGLDRAYVEHEELTTQPRGRLDFTASAKRQTWLTGQMHCSYTDLSYDIPKNQIIKAALTLLYRETKQDKDLKARLADQVKRFEGVRAVRVTPRSFQRIQLHRNNQDYRFILHLCELIFASLLPEHDDEGRKKFRRIEENEKVMPYIFEDFILAFADRNLQHAKCDRPSIHWLADYHYETSQNCMPKMYTDVTIEWKRTGRKLILDCKYYKDAFSRRTYNEDSDEVVKFKSANLYQIFAYLMNKSKDPGWEQVEGMLLYPTNGIEFQESMSLMESHRLQVCSVNLDQDWQAIEKQLIGILEGRHEADRKETV